MYQKIENNLDIWLQEISLWNENIIENITKIIPKNDIFHFPEAYSKLKILFVELITQFF